MRVKISASEAFAKRKISLHFFVTTFVTLKTTSVTPINYTLVSSGSRLQPKPSTRTHGRFYYGRSRPGLRHDPGCARNKQYKQQEAKVMWQRLHRMTSRTPKAPPQSLAAWQTDWLTDGPTDWQTGTANIGNNSLHLMHWIQPNNWSWH